MVLLSTSINAYDFKYENLYYEITGSNTVEVSIEYYWPYEKNYEGLVVADIPSYVINNGITYQVSGIGNSAFIQCSSLQKVVIPNTITYIEDYAFTHCSSLRAVSIPNSVNSLGEHSFDETGLDSIIIPDSLVIVGDNAFADCPNLKYAYVGNNVRYFGNSFQVFEDCPLLTRVDWNVKGIYDENSIVAPFWTNNTITTLVFGDDIDMIPSYLCSGMEALTSVTLPRKITRIENSVFADCISLQSIIIPEGVTSIGEGAFERCSSLEEVLLPNTLTSIEDNAFADCSKIKEIRIPESVLEIGCNAYYGCTSAEYVSLPSTLLRLNTGSFYNCKNIVRMDVYSIIPPEVWDDTFRNVNRSIPVIVPNESFELYKSTEVWKEFNIQCKTHNAIDNTIIKKMNIQKLLHQDCILILRDGVEYTIMGQEL